MSSRRTSSFLLLKLRLFLFEDHERLELVRPDLVEIYSDSQLQRRPKVEGAPKQQARLGGLRGIQLAQRAVGAAAAIFGSVRAEARLTEFVASQRPVNQEAQ